MIRFFTARTESKYSSLLREGQYGKFEDVETGRKYVGRIHKLFFCGDQCKARVRNEETGKSKLVRVA